MAILYITDPKSKLELDGNRISVKTDGVYVHQFPSLNWKKLLSRILKECLRFSKLFISGKINNTRVILQRQPDKSTPFIQAINRLAELKEQVKVVDNIASLRGGLRGRQLNKLKYLATGLRRFISGGWRFFQ